MKCQEKIVKKLWAHLSEFLFPHAEINVPVEKPKEKQERNRVIPHVPYKRSVPLTNDNESLPVKRSKIEQVPKPEKSTQTVPSTKKIIMQRPVIPQSDLPYYKLKQSLQKILPNEPDSKKFSKIFEKFFPSFCFKSLSSEFPMPKVSESKNIFLDDDELRKDVSLIESVSNVSDSFITPEESPMIAPSVAPKITPFCLESPLIHSISATSVEGWGQKSQNSEVPSPQFPQSDHLDKQIKPVILFPIFESIQESEKKDIHNKFALEEKILPHTINLAEEKSVSEAQEMEILMSKENSMSFDRLNEKSEGILVESNKSEKVEEGKPFEIQEVPQNVNPFVGNSQSEASAPMSSNPFLNIQAAEISKPKFVFGSGQSIPQFSAAENKSNPFLSSSFSFNA